MSSLFDWRTLIPLALLAIVVTLVLYRRYAGVSWRATWLASAGVLFVVGRYVVPRVRASEDLSGELQGGYVWQTVCGALFCWLVGPFIARLWGKWVEGRATPAEREAGAIAWQAWLAGKHVIYAVILAALAWQAWDFSIVLGILLFTGALAAYPAIRAAGQMPVDTPPRKAPRPISAEREKVMDLLSAGKITAEESAELLNALGAAATAESPRPEPLDSPQRLMLVGAALLILGFFLPWFTIDAGKDMNHAFTQFATSFGAQVSVETPNGNQFPGFSGLPTGALVMHIAGGDIAHGLGWLVLLLGVVAAAAHYVVGRLDETTLRAIRFAALALGSFIVIYLLSENARHASIGLALAVAGYAIEWIGMIRDSRKMSISAVPAQA